MTDTTRRKWFDPTVNLGHILTFFGFIGAGFVAWSSLDTRLTVVEENRAYQSKTDAYQDQRAADAYTSIKDTLTRIDRTNERIADRLDTLARVTQ